MPPEGMVTAAVPCGGPRRQASPPGRRPVARGPGHGVDAARPAVPVEAGAVEGHAELAHDPLGRPVVRVAAGDEGGGGEAEGLVAYGERGLGGDAAAPELGVEPPADLARRGREDRIGAGTEGHQAGEAALVEDRAEAEALAPPLP